MNTDPSFIAQTVADEDPQAQARFHQMETIPGLQKLVRELRNELAALKGENAMPSHSSRIAHVVVADITAQVEYDYQAEEAPVYDLNSPGCGPGCPELIEPLRIFLNGRWCDLADVRSALADDALVQAISDTRGQA